MRNEKEGVITDYSMKNIQITATIQSQWRKESSSSTHLLCSKDGHQEHNIIDIEQFHNTTLLFGNCTTTDHHRTAA
ncbi:hypothetical protein ACHAXS_007004 [Conticribra weissflogii]